jgi:hypothetical protein
MARLDVLALKRAPWVGVRKAKCVNESVFSQPPQAPLCRRVRVTPTLHTGLRGANSRYGRNVCECAILARDSELLWSRIPARL